MAEMAESILKFFGFLIVLGILFAMIIPALIVFIIHFVKGIKYKWPTKNLVTVIVTGALICFFLLIIILFVTLSINQAINNSSSKNSSIEAVVLFKHICFTNLLKV